MSFKTARLLRRSHFHDPPLAPVCFILRNLVFIKTRVSPKLEKCQRKFEPTLYLLQRQTDVVELTVLVQLIFLIVKVVV